ncbi:HK97 family phage prohead protease [Microbacterium enclense]|uniref:HK97 family phage prohead protease n=1 Tax=Microbacterium enclense TaxID=993073 RepID=UPI0021A51CA3|nr:HK97 family phage prohead protease [Microbacterium enclense]MCT2085046.1 HK97 family phage prohead protease [Microbacterium enclense]
MRTKTIDVEVKAVGDDGSGEFEAYASVFGNIDSYGDVVVKGAFADDLDRWGADGAGIPIYWRHRMDDPFMNLGATLKSAEDDHGLLVRGQLELDEATAAHVYKLIKTGRVRQMSFAYDIVEAGWVEKTENGQNVSYYELRKLRIQEISIVPVGANQETEIVSVKTALQSVETDVTKTGRQLSADERAELIAASRSLKALLDHEDQGTATAPSDAKTEEPEGAKAEEPTTATSTHHLGLITIATAL